jgi:hypothetical protein
VRHDEAPFDALVSMPGWGSLWLHDCQILPGEKGDHVVGWVWADTVGSPKDWLNFPVGCIRRKHGR